MNEQSLDQIEDLYNNFSGNYWDSGQVKNGVFYGIFENDKLIAAVGTHVFSTQFKISAVGNLFIMPEYRSFSCSSQLVASLCHHLYQTGIRHIAWNAQSQSRLAKLYKFWGGEIHCDFVHGYARRYNQF